MKKVLVLFTSGQGPAECAFAVNGVQKSFQNFLKKHLINYKISAVKTGRMKDTIQSITFELKIKETRLLRSWLGSIQWVSKSPMRPKHKRKNWFIKSALFDGSDAIEIDLSDIDIQAFRASGPGGQHRNKVETAIRMTHRESGLSVTASDSKSQLQNKKSALQKLIERLKEENENRKDCATWEQWLSKQEIERGRPVKVFKGMKFKEVR